MTSTGAPLLLGIDLSTQQLKVVLIAADTLSVVHEASVNYDADLPSYRTTNGAVVGPEEGRVTSPVQMWLDALDLVLERTQSAGVDFGRVVGIGGAAQQHGSVYWSSDAPLLLASLDPSRPLGSQGHLSPHAFALPDAPIWQDSSTTRECQELERAVGGAQVLSDLTGSRAYERFTGEQIARIRKLNPRAYTQTLSISLISSFLASLLLQRIAPIEVSDASGMNLMNVLTCKWEDTLLEACGGSELRAKLGPEPVPGGDALGKIGSWWVRRWGFNPECIIAPFTGDNPATVAALSAPGDAILSLGTSTTFLLSIPPPPSNAAPKRTTTSHLLAHPTSPSGHIAMLCYKSGALAREHVRDRYANIADGTTGANSSAKWSRFEELMRASPPGNDGYLGFYFPQREIVPPNVIGEYFFKVRAPHSSGGGAESDIAAIPESAFPAPRHPRAIVESQFLSIKSRVADILPPDAAPLRRLLLAGGSSANAAIQQVAADVFGMHTYVADAETGTKEAAALGGAMLARYAWWRDIEGRQGSFEEMMAEVARCAHHVGDMKLVAVPDGKAARVYDTLVDAYERCEKLVIETCRKKSDV
ncbi:hypothetical protein ID866_7470 [Astraeus odoratus]|nr:hypothetical protein ID866_7470 [Astraeus odoratus]